jgi:hypothetical protein
LTVRNLLHFPLLSTALLLWSALAATESFIGKVEARGAGAGLWRDAEPMPLWTWRKATKEAKDAAVPVVEEEQ